MLKTALKAMIDFASTLLLFRAPWRLWLVALTAVNFIVPFFFIVTLEGQVVLVVAIIAGALEMAIFARLGMVRLVGLGHIVWFPLVGWLWIRLDGMAPGVAIYAWVVAVVVLNCISLVIDVVDVARFVRGERAPHLALKDR